MTDLEPDLETGLVEQRVQLVELVDRVLDRGVVLRGEVTIGVAGVDLVYLELRLLLSSVETLLGRGESGRPPEPAEQTPLGSGAGPPPPIERRPPPGHGRRERPSEPGGEPAPGRDGE